MSSSASTLPKRKALAKRKSRRKAASGWIVWWPVLAGIIVTPLAVRAATLMALTGPDGLRLLYPYVLIPKLHALGLSDALSGGLSQAMMYLQFPLYGLLAMLVLKLRGIVSASIWVALVHFLAVGLLFAVAGG